MLGQQASTGTVLNEFEGNLHISPLLATADCFLPWEIPSWLAFQVSVASLTFLLSESFPLSPLLPIPMLTTAYVYF